MPLQPLDYWIRVKWHLDRGEFRSHGYFPGVLLRKEAPKLLLISLALEFYSGRLAVLELKASQDIHLPLQALDYWIRVKWHLDRDEFGSHGYFPGIILRKEAPKLLLISPSLEFHPTTETILQFLSSDLEIERVGVGVNWREKLQVMFRLRGAETPF